MKRVLFLLAALLTTLAVSDAAFAQGKTKLANICRLKGQEENVLRGIGLVGGLNGSGEANDAATMRALSRALELMGNPVSSTGRFDQQAQQALRNIKNVSLVMVTATVPATGARSGELLDCRVSALNGKSLLGGQLISAALQGPNTQDPTVFGLCEGPLQVINEAQPTVATIHHGCQMSRDVYTPFVSEDGWVTIVLDPHHASFSVAESIAAKIGNHYAESFLQEQVEYEEIRDRYVRPLDASNIRVKVPAKYESDTVAFVSELLDEDIYEAEPEARVICNTRTGSVVISGDVEIGSVVYNHRNLMVDTTQTNNFLAISPGTSTRPKLDQLVAALQNLRVPTDDVIDIIRGINDLGLLHAKLIVR
ncbi:Flagellar P-ring protein precursor [Botrimarina colliarenosi]|uniref:Flagellar P-ring protein n=1 Tax=Botrimarina colliarenosi TaxID=2528001 RepID=A0A5C6AJ00_9BACT|nr:flagellar basal body P-ring protein FlgI [Botrimarina colliarenosi]TWT99366.1 Flagellar P-ring protein precursor [Botrimarina colliarenosi]